MLDAETTSRTSEDLFFSPAPPRPADDPSSIDRIEGPPSDDSVEGPLSDLMCAARKLIAAIRSETQLSERARQELNEAHHLIEALRVTVDRGDAGVPVPPEGLMVADDGTWFQTPSGRVDVARRGAVKRILVGLADARMQSAGKALGVDELFEIGWPGEKIPYESQVRRVYTAIWTLRTLGLDGLLLTRDEGYLLDPKRAVRLAA
jgi:hypothetical protein